MKNQKESLQKLSPSDLKNKEFKRTVWGYAPQEVVDFLAQAAKLLASLQQREKETNEEIRTLKAEIKRWEDKESELDEIRKKALLEAEAIIQETKKEAATLFSQARNKAEEMRIHTEEWLTTVLSQVQETERKRETFIQDFKSFLDRQYELFEDQSLSIHKPFEGQLEGVTQNH